MSYATPTQFIQAYGLRETAQLLQDEDDLLTEHRLRWALDVAQGITNWGHYVPPVQTDPSLLDDLHSFAWLVFNGQDNWSNYAPPAGYASPSQAQTDTADVWVQDSITAADAAALRLQTALNNSSSEIDGYLRGVMALPIDPAQLSNTLLDECCWVLTRCRLADDCDNTSDKIEQNCKDTRQWLKDIARGTVSLLAPDSTALAQVQRIRTGQARSGYDWRAHRGRSGGILPSEMQGTGTRT